MKRLLTLCFVLIATALTAAAQSTHTTGGEEMRKLDFLVGNWRGEGWMQRGPGGREAASISESVQAKAGGRVFVIEGVGKAPANKAAGRNEETIVHNAFAILYYDEAAKRYRMQAFLANGQATEAETSLKDGVFEWGFQLPQGKVRYKTRLNEKGQWFEEGEFSMDGGKTYRKFFEMTLDRVK